MSFEFFRQSDGVFRVIWILTILWCVVWPLTVLPTVMSLAATPVNKEDYVWKLFWFLLLIYPLIFVMMVRLGQGYVADIYYWLGVAVALLPTVAALWAIRWFLKS